MVLKCIKMEKRLEKNIYLTFGRLDSSGKRDTESPLKGVK